MKSISVKAFAKINLSIDVIEKMDTGYHRVEMVMQQIDIADDVLIEADGVAGIYAGYHIKLNSSGDNLPKKQEDNLAYKAAKLMAETFWPHKNNKVKITLNKLIPTAAGLAGGSSDAAAVMLGLCKLWNIEIKLEDLCKIGAQIGADVPFCLIGNAKNNPDLCFEEDEMSSSAAMAKGVGDILTPVPTLNGWVVIVKPNISVPTPFVYEKLSQYKALPGQGNDVARPNTQDLVLGLKSKDYELITKNMINVLETVSLKEYPIVVYTKNKIAHICKSTKVLMSGSGPTIFAYFEDKEQASKAFADINEAFLSESVNQFDIRLAQLL